MHHLSYSISIIVLLQLPLLSLCFYITIVIILLSLLHLYLKNEVPFSNTVKECHQSVLCLSYELLLRASPALVWDSPKVALGNKKQLLPWWGSPAAAAVTASSSELCQRVVLKLSWTLFKEESNGGGWRVFGRNVQWMYLANAFSCSCADGTRQHF